MARKVSKIMDTFHGDDGRSTLLSHTLALPFSDMHCFDNDGDELDYLTSLMSDDNDEAGEEVSLRCSTKVEKPKGRTESGAFDEELDTVAKNKKRRLSQETQAHKKRRKEQSRQENEKDNKTTLLEGE